MSRTYNSSSSSIAKISVSCIALLVATSLCTSAHAAMLTGAIGNDGFGGFDGSITSSAGSEIAGRESELAMDGTGLELGGHVGNHVSGNLTSWLGAVTTSWWKVDLGQAYNLSTASFYNFNPTALNIDRGVQTADIYVFAGSDEPNANNGNLSGNTFDNAGWTLFSAGHSFTQAPGGDLYNTPDTINFAGTQARFVAFDILTNYGDGFQTGIAEVQFFGTVVPEPSSSLAMLGLLGLVGLCSSRRRGSAH